MNWAEIKITTKDEAVDVVANILFEVGVKGVVVEDPKDMVQIPQDDWDLDHIPQDDLDTGVVAVTGYLVEDSSLCEKIRFIDERLKQLPQYGFDIGKGKINITAISKENWAEAWKKYYKPTPIGKNIVICPSWEDYVPKKNNILITLDPGMAFGTGTHESTINCLELLEDYVKPNSVIIDVGCGSGILSIAAAKLGANKVIAIDNDPAAVKVAKENVIQNSLDSKIQVVLGDKLKNIDLKADIIVANIIADVIIDLCETISFNLKSEGIFISSGIIRERKFSVMKALEKNGFDIIEQKTMKEWVALVATLASIEN